MKRKLSNIFICLMLCCLVIIGFYSYAYADTADEETTAGANEYETSVVKETISGFVTENGYTYYYSETGVMQKSKFVTVGKYKYYFNSKGHMVTGKKKIGKYTYYFTSTGKMKESGFKTINGAKYYFNSKGHMVTGKKKIGKYTYYFTSTGKMKKSGFKTIDGKKYYFNSKGHMVTGRKKLNNNIYYFNSKGVLYRTVYGSKKMVALTYDDGPATGTETILDTLEEYNSVATFFVVGSRVKYYKSSVKRAYKMGCQIGSHTYNHTILTKVSASKIKKEMNDTNSILKKTIGVKATVMRTPGGATNSTVKQNVKMPIILWSIDTLDWKTRSSSSTISAVLNNVTDGDIVLMHDLHESTAVASKTIIPKLVNKGYQLVTVEEMAMLRGGMENGKVYYSFKK